MTRTEVQIGRGGRESWNHKTADLPEQGIPVQAVLHCDIPGSVFPLLFIVINYKPPAFSIVQLRGSRIASSWISALASGRE